MSLKLSKTIYTSAFVFGLLSASYKSFKVLKSENNEKDVRRVREVFKNFAFLRRSLEITDVRKQWLGFWVVFGVLSMNVWTSNLRKLRTVLVVGMQFSDIGEDLQNYVFVHLTTPLLRLCERGIERCRAPALKMIHRPILDLTYWIQKQIVDYVATRDEEKSSEELEKHLEEMRRVIGRERRKRETEDLRSSVSKNQTSQDTRIKKSSNNDENDAKKASQITNSNVRRFKNRIKDRFFGRHSIGIFRQGGAFTEDGELR